MLPKTVLERLIPYAANFKLHVLDVIIVACERSVDRWDYNVKTNLPRFGCCPLCEACQSLYSEPNNFCNPCPLSVVGENCHGPGSLYKRILQADTEPIQRQYMKDMLELLTEILRILKGVR